jgi:hypothetical protein
VLGCSSSWGYLGHKVPGYKDLTVGTDAMVRLMDMMIHAGRVAVRTVVGLDLGMVFDRVGNRLWQGGHTVLAVVAGHSLIGCTARWDRDIVALVVERHSPAAEEDSSLAVAARSLDRTRERENHIRRGPENRSSAEGIGCMGQT